MVPYVKNQKNDANDAEGICEAVSRTNMRFVPVKSFEQQDMQGLHRIREQLVKQRTAMANQEEKIYGGRGTAKISLAPREGSIYIVPILKAVVKKQYNHYYASKED